MSPVTRRVVLLLPEHVHLLDVAGPAQVFVAANDVGGAYDVRFVAERGRVDAHQGLGLEVDDQLPTLGPQDLLLVAGQRSSGPDRPGRQFSSRILAALRAHHEAGGEVGSICSGARTLAEAGLLDGRQCTTHHELVHELQRDFPRAQVHLDRLFVIDGRVRTSAGVASGIDLALDLVADDLGPRAAAAVARTLVLPLRRSTHSTQHSAVWVFRDHLSDLVHRAQDIIEERFDTDLTLTSLAEELGVSPRTLTRRFVAATQITPLAYRTRLRMDTAARLVESGMTSEAAAKQVGFADARSLRALRAREG
ncbi:GlxA family transcriptional regulator [Propionibacteriaceae bacterium Y1685]